MHAQSPPRRTVLSAHTARSFFLRVVLATILATAVVVGSIYLPEPDQMVMLRQTVVVMLTSDDPKKRSQGTGTIVWSGKGYSFVLTNDHVIDTNRHGVVVVVYKYDAIGRLERERYLRATLVRSSPDLDLALLRLEEELPHVATLAQASPPVFTPVYSIGGQIGFRPLVTKGEIAQASDVGGGMFLLSAPIMPGSSGGAYYARRGGRFELVGVPTRLIVYRRQYVPHLGLGLSIEAVGGFLADCQREELNQMGIAAFAKN